MGHAGIEIAPVEMERRKDTKVVAAGTLPLEHFGMEVPDGNRRSATEPGEGEEGRQVSGGDEEKGRRERV